MGSSKEAETESRNEAKVEASKEAEAETEAALTQLLNQLTDNKALPVRVHYLADQDMPNAFATLGGHIFITRGLLDSVESENGLAMVLAHEYGHILVCQVPC